MLRKYLPCLLIQEENTIQIEITNNPKLVSTTKTDRNFSGDERNTISLYTNSNSILKVVKFVNQTSVPNVQMPKKSV